MKASLLLAFAASAMFSLSASAQTSPEVTLTRIECGTAAKPTNDSNGVPSFNYDRAATVASLERVKKIVGQHQGDGHHPARQPRHRQAACLA
jgi:hypothetical protein